MKLLVLLDGIPCTQHGGGVSGVWRKSGKIIVELAGDVAQDKVDANRSNYPTLARSASKMHLRSHVSLKAPYWASSAELSRAWVEFAREE